MSRRILELAVMVALIAGLGFWLRPTDGPVEPLATPEPAATPAATPSPEPHMAPVERTRWQSLYDEAQAALGQGDNARAEARLLEALKVAPTAHEKHETLDDLGLVCYRLGRYENSFEYQAQAVEAAVEAEGNGPTAALYQSRLALALEAAGRHEDALLALRLAGQTYSEAYADDPASLDAAREELAAIARGMGENDLAVQLLDGR